MNTKLTRRTFGKIIGAGLLSEIALPHAATAIPAANPTATEVVERIKKRLAQDGILWKEPTVDTFKIGDPATPVTGIATCWMATFEVLKRAAADKRNFVISHEPTFWNHLDDVTPFTNDPVYLAKKAFVEQNKMVVWRFHDFWHAVRPDPVFAALAQQLDWKSGPNRNYVVPTTTLSELGKQVQSHLKTRTVRIVGDPNLKITRIGFTAHTLSGCVNVARNADAVLMGEPREFDTFEYFRDAQALNQPKGLIGISHDRLEEWGMLSRCADWVKAFVPEVPVSPVAVDDWYWIP